MASEIIVNTFSQILVALFIRLQFLIIFTLINVFPTQLIAQQLQEKQPWVLSKKSTNTSVNYRNLKQSPLIEIKAEVIINSTLSGFLLFMQDTENSPTWLDNAVESKIIEELNPTTSVLMTRFAGFFLIKDRFMLIKNTYWQNKDLSIEIKSVNADMLNQEKLGGILIDVISAHWLITPFSENKLSVNYQFIVDARGNIPHWLVNKMALNSTWKTLENLRQQIPHSKWQKRTLPHIKELN